MDANPHIYQCPLFTDWHDPIAVRRKLYLGSGEQFNVWLEEQRGADVAAAMRAQEKLIPVVREAFKLPPIEKRSGAGVSDEQALQVLDLFLRWLEGKVERASPSQHAQPCTGCPRQ